MPPLCADPGGNDCLTATHKANISAWSSNGAPLRPAVASALFEDLIDHNSARINATINTNTLSQGSYNIEYGLTTSYGTSVASGSRNSISPTSPSGNTGNVLQCGTTYQTRATATNGAASNSVTGTFATSACTAPILGLTGAGTFSSPIGVPKGTSFTQPSSLSISLTEINSAITWSFTQPPPGGGSISSFNTSTGAFTYTAPATSGSTSFTLTVTDSDPFTPVGAVGPNSATVTVYVTIVDNPPQFQNMAGDPISLPFTAGPVLEGDGSTPSLPISFFAADADGDDLTWSISSGPVGGTLGPFSNGTGPGQITSNSITFTPNADVDVDGSFTVQLFDGLTNVNLPVTVDITPEEDDPVAVDDGPIVFDVGVPVLISVLTDGVDFDVDTSDSISILGTSITPPVNAGATAVQVGNQIQYTSAASAAGAASDSFQYRVVDTTARTSNLASVTMTPRNSDGDTIPDYIDNCPGTTNEDQLNTDMVPLANSNTTTDPGGSLGGDACDNDDDDDDMPDLYELANMLDPLDASDRNTDNDGDGISNYQEFIDGTNPNFANEITNATGYLTPYSLPTPAPTTVHPLATSVSASDYGPYRPGRHTITWTGSNASNDALAPTSDQTLDIRPLLSFSANQQVEEGSAVVVRVNLNGDPVAYPVTVDYSVSGTSTSADHDAASGSGVVTFNSGYSQTITFNVFGDLIADPNETVVFTLSNPGNATLGAKKTHRVTIVEGNVAPKVSLQFAQNLNTVTSTYDGEGAIDVTAAVSDVNGTQTHSYDWSGSDSALIPLASGATWTIATPAAGNYLIDVVVTDIGSPTPQASTRISRILKVIAGTAPAVDVADDDDDGIPNYLDLLSGANESHLVPAQTVVDTADRFLVETENGLKLSTGNTAQAAGSYGTLLTDSEITDFGSSIGDPPVNASDSYRHVGGIYNFEVSGLEAGSSARVVIPLQSAIPRNASYRKFNPAIGWGGFVVDANNRVASARGARGACPAPGSSLYVAGLRYLDNCVELLILDGGPNDSDNAVNGAISDPGAVGVRLTSPQLAVVEEGAGRLSLQLLLLLVLLGGIAVYLRLGGARASE